MKITANMEKQVLEIESDIKEVDSHIHVINRLLNGQRTNRYYARKYANFSMDELKVRKDGLVAKRQALRNKRNSINREIYSIRDYYKSFTPYYVNSSMDNIMNAYNDYKMSLCY